MKKQNSQFGKTIDKQAMKTIKGGWGSGGGSGAGVFLCRSNNLIYATCPSVSVCPLRCVFIGDTGGSGGGGGRLAGA